MTRVHVGGADPYDVLIGTGVLGELPGMVGDRARTVAVVHAEGLPEIARPVRGALEQAGYTVHALPVPDGEAAKEVGVLAGLWSSFARFGMTRTDVVVGVGGGATTDLAGFAAASWLRGVRAVLVPTTLLGMVDAAVGGKTGINVPEGKNLVGAFHPPAGVLCDLATLVTMPREDYISGLAEIIKAASSPTRRSSTWSRTTRGAPPPRTARTPASWSSAPSGQGRRGLRRPPGERPARDPQLRPHPRPRHREGRGLPVPARPRRRDRHGLRRRAGPPRRRLPAAVVQRHRDVLSSVGLPVSYAADWPGLRETMTIDKKSRGATLRFVVLDGIAEPGRLEGPDEALLAAAYRKVGR